jgi:SCY1-like protein 2
MRELTPIPDILPIIFTALESPTPSLVDAALRSLPAVLPQLDFSTIKNELFPVIAAIFSKTSSLAIKVRGLQAFVILCGGSNTPGGDDGLDGLTPQKKATSSTALDKFTMQEKIVPLIKAIKTKEPAVMIAALNVLRVVGKVADADFVAMDVLPILWSMSLGPLLDLKQFQSFMELIKSLSSRVEEEQTKKLQELTGGNSNSSAVKDDFMSFGPIAGSSLDANGTTETDFESLVKGGISGTSTNPMDSGWDSMAAAPAVTSPTSTSRKSTPTAAFSWSSPPAAPAAVPTNQFGAVKAQQPSFRTVTPDLTSFQPITPTTTQFSQPLQPAQKPSSLSSTPSAPQSSSINWGAATTSSNTNIWSSQPAASQPSTSAFGSLSLGQQQQQQQQTPPQTQNRPLPFSLPPPPGNAAGASGLSSFSLAPPPGMPQRQQSAPATATMGSMGSAGASAFGGLGGMNGMSGMAGGMGGMNSLASMGATTAAAAASRAGVNPVAGMNMNMGMGMGMGVPAMPAMPAMNSMNTSMGNGMGMGGMMGAGMGMGMGMGGMGGLGPQQQQQQSQGQGQRSGLDKYESLL